MRAVSNRFARKLADNSNMLVKASVKFADGTKKELTGDDFCAVSVESACSSAGSFDIGSAIIGKLECTLNNYDDRFSEYDFQDAEIAVYVGERFEGGETEWIRLGTYWCDQPDSYAGQIQVSALDCLHKLEGKVDWSVFEYPNMLPYFAEKACEHCGLIFEAPEDMRSGFSIHKKPSNPDMSWLDLLGYIAQISCGFVVATDDGHVALKWYDTTAFEHESWCDGGEFDESSPYSTGGKADGGDFTDYSTGANVDGGTFLASNGRVLVSKFSQLTVCTDDVVITGVSVTEQNEVKDSSGVEVNGEDGKTSLYGSQGYVLSIEKNPFILYSLGGGVSSAVGKRCVGMRFRPFSADIVADPSIEVGDPVVIIDRKDNVYRSYVTSLTLSVNGSMSIGCEAKSPGRNAAEQASAATKAIVAARNDLKREQTARELAYKDLQDKVAESGGLFTTRQTLADGSTVTFMHNKADLASSKVIWKMTAEAVAVSTDGGKTYATGLSADGTALLNRIYAIGLDASYINTGELDASNVRIKNLMQIGSGETSLKLSDNSIVFNAFGKESLEISPTTSYPKIIELKNDDGTPLLKVTGPGSSTYTSDFYPQNPHIGKCHIEPLGDGTGYLAWYSVTLSIYDPKNGGDIVFSQTDTIKMLYTDSSYDAEEHVFRVPLYISNTVKISIWFSGFFSVDNTYDSAISVTLSPTGNYLMKLNNATYSTWDSVVGAAIVDKRNDVTFLTNKNYMALLNYGHTYTGRTNIPYVRGNTMRNYIMQFDHGLLSDFKILTPTDPGFEMP